MREWLLALAGLFITLCVVPPAAFGQGPTIEEVAAIQSRHEAAIMALPGVVGVGISKSGVYGRGNSDFHLPVADQERDDWKRHQLRATDARPEGFLRSGSSLSRHESAEAKAVQ
jgi:hypothetical protein